MRTRSEAISNAARVLVDGAVLVAQMTPHEQAVAAWTPSSPYTVAELEVEIRKRRGEPAAA